MLEGVYSIIFRSLLDNFALLLPIFNVFSILVFLASISETSSTAVVGASSATAGASSACCVFCISFNAAISLSPTNVTTRCSGLASASYLPIASNTLSTVANKPVLVAASFIVSFTLISTDSTLPSASTVPVNSTGPLAN